MDIQKEKDELQRLINEMHDMTGTWSVDQMVTHVWQAAKVSVPEGFVLVKRDFTNAAAYAAKSVDGRLSAFKYGDVWNVMVEAQEPSND